MYHSQQLNNKKYLQKAVIASCVSLSFVVPGFPALASAETSSLKQGIYEIHAGTDQRFCVDSKMCTERTPEETAKDQSLGTFQMYESLGVNQQRFYLDEQADGSFLITSLLNGQNLISGQVNTDKTDDTLQSASIQLSLPPEDEEAHTWTVIPCDSDNQKYYIQADNDLYLTSELDYPKNQSGVALSSFTGEKTQQWIFVDSTMSAEDYADTDSYNPYAENGIKGTTRIYLDCVREREIITSSMILDWITETDSHGYQLDTEKVDQFISDLSESYSTQGVGRFFTKHNGTEIEITNGDYGWKMDTKETAKLVKDAILNGESRIINAKWKNKANSFDSKDDIGSSYIEVDLTNQKLWLYENGKELLETDIVSGTYNNPDRKTPSGIYGINYKQSPAVLRGADYASPVTYWMPFWGGYGLHDATWRGSFGGDIYLSSGSHGCVNLPLESAKLIYQTVHTGYPVILYYEEAKEESK